MKITFLGTGTSQGIPVIGSNHPVCLSKDPKDKRLRTSALLQWDDKSIAIDCGPDFRMQMINSECNKLDAIFFTHEHNDHVALARLCDMGSPIHQSADFGNTSSCPRRRSGVGELYK